LDDDVHMKAHFGFMIQLSV